MNDDKSTDSLVGTWQLASCEARSERGDVELLYGDRPFGRLMYGADSRMSVIISEPDPSAGTALICETPDSFSGVLAYCGSYRCATEARRVTHSVEWCTIRSWNGTEQVRFFELSGGALHISTAPYERNGQSWVSTLVWRKL